MSPRSPGMATADSFQTQPTPTPKSVLLYSFQRVLRATRSVSASGRNPPGRPLVKPNQINSYSLAHCSFASETRWRKSHSRSLNLASETLLFTTITQSQVSKCRPSARAISRMRRFSRLRLGRFPKAFTVVIPTLPVPGKTIILKNRLVFTLPELKICSKRGEAGPVRRPDVRDLATGVASIRFDRQLCACEL